MIPTNSDRSLPKNHWFLFFNICLHFSILAKLTLFYLQSLWSRFKVVFSPKFCAVTNYSLSSEVGFPLGHIFLYSPCIITGPLRSFRPCIISAPVLFAPAFAPISCLQNSGGDYQVYLAGSVSRLIRSGLYSCSYHSASQAAPVLQAYLAIQQ